MTRQSVTSAAIKSIGHDPETLEMEVEFHNGKVYGYQNVSEEDHAEFISASSIGKHFNNHIAGKFEAIA